MFRNWSVISLFTFLAVTLFVPCPTLAVEPASIDMFETGADEVIKGNPAVLYIRTTGITHCEFTQGKDKIANYSDTNSYANESVKTINLETVGTVFFAIKCYPEDRVSGVQEAFASQKVAADKPGGTGQGGPKDEPPAGGGTSGGSNNTGALKCAKSDELCNPLPVNSVVALVFQLLRSVLLILGGLTVAVIVYGGFQMVISSGNPDALKTAKATITWAILGLVVALLSYSIVGIVQSLLEVSG